jgi:hypothetical protein
MCYSFLIFITSIVNFIFKNHNFMDNQKETKTLRNN